MCLFNCVVRHHAETFAKWQLTDFRKDGKTVGG